MLPLSWSETLAMKLFKSAEMTWKISNKRKLKTSTTTKVLKWKVHLMCSRNLVDSKTRLGHKNFLSLVLDFRYKKYAVLSIWIIGKLEWIHPNSIYIFPRTRRNVPSNELPHYRNSETVDMTTSCCYLKRIRFFTLLPFAQLKTR